VGNMEWKDRIPKCFGSADHQFGRLHSDLVRAAEMLVELVKENVPWPHFERAVRDFLEEEGKDKPQEAIQTHVNEEILLMRQYFEKWLPE
jgi:hypothetical protein